MQLELALQSRRGPSLRIADSPDAAWDGCIVDWFAEAATTTWTGELPAVVVVPTHSHAQALRSRLLASGLSALGVQFFTPPYLRGLLQREAAATTPAAAEHLRLLLAIAAEEGQNSKLPEREQLAATSVRRMPDHLLRLLEQLGAAGWSFDDVELPAFRPIVRRFREHLCACDFEILAQSDRHALGRAKAEEQLFGNVLVSGFHAAHWPLWHLLQATITRAKNATVVLQYPREETADLDAAWIGSWEESFGEAQPVHAPTAPESIRREPLFLIGQDTHEQAQAIATATVQFLGDDRCSRLAIVFPGTGALSRLVASSLTRIGLPHHDAMGQLLPGVFETASFAAWMELQRTPRLNALVRFLHSLEGDHVLFAHVSRARLEKNLRNALSEIALDDLAVLGAYCAERGATGEAARDLLATIIFLPERATMSEFLEATANAFRLLKWDERWREIEARGAWCSSLPAIFSRTLYVRWLSEVASTLRLTRDAIGSHPYARVQLLTPAQADSQTWSHLIIAGLNEGAWPAGARGDFLPTEQIEAFNQRVQKFNRAATRRGRQGEGHVALREGNTLFLGAQQQRQLAQAQFASLLESASVGYALTASLTQEAAPERISNPSDFFSRLYQQERGTPVSQTTMRALREATRQWLSDSALSLEREIVSTPSTTQTAVAYSARRDERPSGEYDFSLRTPPPIVTALSVSEFEELLKSPALVWMKRFLGVEAPEDATYAWNSTVGKWTHDWLASIGGKHDGFIAFPAAADLEGDIAAAAERQRVRVLQLCRTAGRTLPDWWQSAWEGASCLARALGQIIATAEDWPWAANEWKIEEIAVPITADRSLLLRGRADLLLARAASRPTSLEQLPDLWIVDFKTGNKKLPSPKRSDPPEQQQKRVAKLVLKREALQLALYALAARQLGAQDVGVSLISPLVRQAQPQITLEDFDGCNAAFAELARMQQTGIFGLRGALRGAFTFTRSYPLATLAVSRDLVEERWEITHEALALDEEPYW